jgi:hypothetical protein
MEKYQPLRNNWAINEDSGVPVVDQIRERVNAEDWFTNCKGYPLIKEVQGKLGRPLLETIKQEVIIS